MSSEFFYSNPDNSVNRLFTINTIFILSINHNLLPDWPFVAVTVEAGTCHRSTEAIQSTTKKEYFFQLLTGVVVNFRRQDIVFSMASNTCIAANP